MRILHAVSILDISGMGSYIVNMYRCIDRTRVQFDFLVHRARRGVFEDEIEALGGHVYHTILLDDFNLPNTLRLRCSCSENILSTNRTWSSKQLCIFLSRYC